MGLVEEFKKIADIFYIDLSEPIDKNGPYDIIIHKLDHELNSDDDQKRKMGENLLSYMLSHEEDTLCIDDPKNVMILYSRIQSNNILSSFCVNYTCSQNYYWKVMYPPSIVVNFETFTEECLEKRDLKYPLIFKPDNSGGSVASHKLTIFYNFEQLQKVFGLSLSPVHSPVTSIPSSFLTDSSFSFPSSFSSFSSFSPFILQQLINHTPIVRKIYTVLGEGVYQTYAPGLPSEVLDGSYPSAYTFQTQNSFGKENVHPEDMEGSLPSVPFELLEKTTEKLASVINVELFGYDLVRSIEDPFVLYIVDVNYLPGYKKIPNASAALIRNVLKRYDKFIERRKNR